MIKVLIYRFIVYSGLLRLWIFRNRKAINFLMLHGVMDKQFKAGWQPFWNRISPEFLEKHLTKLSRYYQFVSLDEAVEMLSGRKPIKPNCMVITFDDGYKNNLQYAMPILRKFSAPATIYLATEYVSKQTPFHIDRLDYALQSIEIHGRKFTVNDRIIEYDTSSRAMLTKSYLTHRLAIQAGCKNEKDYHDTLNALALELETESGDSIFKTFRENDWVNILTWDDIRSYSYNDVQFEGHTVHHYKLALLSPDQIREELSASRGEIEKQTGEPCKHVCYPVGSFNQTTIDIAKDCGYTSAVTTEVGLNRVGCDLFRIRRMPFPYEGDIWSNIICLSGLGYSIASLIRRMKGLYSG